MADPYDIAALRQEYEATGLDESEVDADPIVQFRRWLDAAVSAGYGSAGERCSVAIA